MKNPLFKRLPRELFGELTKYLVIFILLIATIGFVSGFLVADGSMIKTYNESFEKYNIEDGNFLSAMELSDEQVSEIEKQDITLYENFYVEEEVENDSTLRIFKSREEVDLVCLMDGALPEKTDEIAIDRMYADNNGIEVGDTLTVGGRTLAVTGLVALSDYSTMFSDNNDMMFDAIKFGVAIMTKAGFASYDEEDIHYSYAWKYDTAPADEKDEKKVSDELGKEINKVTPLEAFIPRYANQAIQFTGVDMGGDRSMIMVLLYIIIAIMAFVFAVTTVNTITKEAAVIGTLRALGYTRGELLFHYLSIPVVVTLIGAAIGNILGYTVFKYVCADMYYGSYSLPTYETVWSPEAFILTTIVPAVLMIVINMVILWRKLKLSPLKFLRRDLKKNSRKKVIRLNKSLPFFTRFRLRILLQNRSNYITLFVGILFANLLLMFGLFLPALLEHYQDQIVNEMICDYQYILKAPVDTKDGQAEKFAMTSLETREEDGRKEQITVYGIDPDSDYVDVELEKGDVYISDGFAGKFRAAKGDSFTLKERYGDKTYDFTAGGIYDYPAALTIFMDIDDFRETFDFEKDYFNGYFSNKELDDIEDMYIASVINRDDLTKVSRQLQVSMGDLMYLVDGFAILIFFVVMYLLSKIIIEKNAQSISMAKILGYRDGEIGRLYILSTSIIVAASVLISLPAETVFFQKVLYYYLMKEMNGWLSFYIDGMVYIKMVVLGLLTYALVAVLEFRRIRRVPMGEALKNVE